jgi:hypothetical protein
MLVGIPVGAAVMGEIVTGLAVGERVVLVGMPVVGVFVVGMPVGQLVGAFVTGLPVGASVTGVPVGLLVFTVGLLVVGPEVPTYLQTAKAMFEAPPFVVAAL